MLAMNKPEWLFIVIGCVACIINGGIQPVFGIILSKLTAVFQECDPEVQKDRVLLYILLFIGFGILILVAKFLQVEILNLFSKSYIHIFIFRAFFLLYPVKL